MNKIKIMSRLLRGATGAAIAFQFIILGLAWNYLSVQGSLSQGHFYWGFLPQALYRSGMTMSALPASTKIMMLGVATIEVALTTFLLFMLFRVFSCYEQCEIFSERTIGYYKWIAATLLCSELLHPFIDVAMTYLATLHNPPGHRFITISFSNANAFTIFLSACALVVSWIMSEAHKLQVESTLTV